jgi:hypothetical protein
VSAADFYIFGSATPSRAFERFLARQPPSQRERLRRLVDRPQARAFMEMEAAFRQHIAERQRQVDRAPGEGARAVALARAAGAVKAAERADLNSRLSIALGKSHGLARELASWRR